VVNYRKKGPRQSRGPNRKFQFIALLLIGLRPMQCFALLGCGLPRQCEHWLAMT